MCALVACDRVNKVAANQDHQLEVIPSTALESITRGEIDVQISTAHKFPRSMTTFKRRAVEMATLDEETAASCLYSRPVGGGKFAEGLSVRTAEIVGACYGNLRVGAMIVEQTERYVTARGMAHDLESNFASSCEVIESTVKKDGTPYDERMRVVIAKACLAKARRDATFQVVPKALCKPIEAAARAVALGDASTLASRRDACMGWIGKLGIEPARVFAAIGVIGADEIGIDQLATLTGLRTAIREGDVTVDEAFPQIVKAAKVPPIFAPTTQNNPSIASDATGSEEPSGKKDDAPAVVKQSRQTKPDKAPPLTLDATPVSLRQQVSDKMKSANLEWFQVASAAESGGLFIDAKIPLDEQPDDILTDILSAWSNLEPMAKAI